MTCAKANEIAGGPVDEYTAGMIEHDMHVGQLLNLLDELGIADNTIVHYSTDNGPHYNTWPDAAATPFFGEKNTNWEGGWRVPSMVRWPGKIKAGSVTNEIVHHMDWLPTLLAAAGRPQIKEELKKPVGSRPSVASTRCTSTATTSCRCSPARRTRVRARRSSTSPMTAT
jgi:arylsulfatase A-like enzyme